MKGAWRALPALLVLLAICQRATGDTQALQCTESAELKASGLFWSCQNFGSIPARLNTTYLLTVDPPSATYQQFDINITLTSLTGDADLIVVTPGATSNLASTRNVGQDIVFVYRTELAAGQYEVVVLGYALETEYELTVELVEPTRSLRPEATLALGQMMVDCCATDATACTLLKAQFPQLNSNNPDINPDYCYMHGNVCDRSGAILELAAFAGGDLSCKLPGPAIMGKLTHLERLDLSGNRITGNITEVAQTLAGMPALEYVDLGYNELEGAFDSACGLAATKKLEELSLMNNALSGSLPSCITQLPELVELHLDFNQLTGTIPAFATTNSPLEYFSASFQMGFLSGLSGSVPTSLGKLPKLAYLDLGGNMLTGKLPPSLPASMIDLRLAENQLTGSIPASYGLMVNLVSLELQSNTLEGTLPAGLAALPALKLLDASGNRLSGALPADWSAARPLTLLMLASNALTGPLPASLASLSDLVVLDLRGNALSGTLAEFGFATQANRQDLHSSLRYFDIGNNSLNGDLEHAEGLKDIAVFSNYAPLAITPDAAQALAANTSGSTIRIRALMTPRTFDISFNAFDGTFPEWLVESLADCKEDVTIVLDGNKLMCPEHGFALERAAPAGRLDGLFCYQARASVEVTDATPMANITSLAFVAHHHLSGGAVFGIIVAVLLGVAGLAGLGYWGYKRYGDAVRGTGRFKSFDKYDSGAAAGPMQGGGLGATHVHASSGPKFGLGGGRMVYPDMHEVEMGDPTCEQLGRESPTKGYNVKTKSGRQLELP